MLRRALTLLAAAVLGTAPALAQDTAPTGGLRNGFDGEIELYRPNFSPEILPGIDVARNWRGGSARFGVALGYSRAPLVLYQFDREVGAIVANRFSAVLGGSVDVSRRVTLRASLPIYYQNGTQIPLYASEGAAMGDLLVGAHYAFFTKPVVALGVRADLFTPTSRKGYYAGERLPHIQAALLATFDVGRVRVASDLGVDARFKQVDTQSDFTLGSELLWNNGVRVNVIREKLDLGLSIYARFGFANFFGAAESSGEALLNFGYKATDYLVVEAGAGRGFTLGYGSTDVRAYVNLRFQKKRKEYEPPPPDEGAEALLRCDTEYRSCIASGREKEVCDALWEQCKSAIQFNVTQGGGTIIVPPEVPPEVAPPLVDDPVEDWENPDQVARVRSDFSGIDIRFAIEFERNTSNILEKSLPVVDAVADIMNSDARIAHLVIEGHASPEGEDSVNFPLSESRAGSIWRRIVEKGVHPSRLSFRGMGEVLPIYKADGTEDLEASRRVVFQIVRMYDPALENLPTYNLRLRYPWNGQPYLAVQPQVPTDEQDEQLRELMRRDDVRAAPDQFQDLNFAPKEEEDDEEDDAPLGEEPPAAPPADAEETR